MSIARTAWTDDDGTGTTGTIVNNAERTTLYDQLDARWSRATITSTGTQNNLSISEADYVIFNNATDLTITGLVAPASPAKPGKPVRYVCIGAGNVFFQHENAGSTAANRFTNMATSGDTPHLGGVGRGILTYDDSSSRWRLIHHEQGGFITPAFNAANFSASGTMTWTLTSPDVSGFGYWLRGRELVVVFTLDTTTVGGTVSTDLRILNTAYGGFTAIAQQFAGAIPQCLDNNVFANAFWQMNASGTFIRCLKQTLGNWTLSTNQTTVYGQAIFGVT